MSNKDFSQGSETLPANERGLPARLGNAAKLYCLQRVDELAAHRGDLTILDLGCGTGRQILPLLERHPHLRFVGVEPRIDDAAKARELLSPFHADIQTASAYDVEVQADVILSFSAMEHVYRRDRYLASIARNLREDGMAFVNYDSGHFVGPAPDSRLRVLVGKLLALLGQEKYYKSLVRDDEFLFHVRDAGLTVAEEKMFNCGLKDVYHLVPDAQREDFMVRWYELELWLNDLGIIYTDDMAYVFRTRNFILRPATAG